MIRVVSKWRAEAESGKAIPNNLLWPCLSSAWDAVTKVTISICFARVLTIPPEIKDLLRTADDLDNDNKDVEQLKQEIMELYHDRVEAIKKQNCLD
ncbi:hypothetical protein BC939DRAFT_434227 [Gamsiella multidivaricata]|uniref:uncharacterized protein n=1 Tax=Gamsiella multidivaricata TaxID=101098 RepID=UPI002220ED1C|nr:uncharacterized protein BC939DRAFT_434227 [Gamsiella multidivaricata]KAI7832736.1 hypothetical protein BC939DRAFT_434227 [Gamsiella multidivaricata]